MSDLSATESDTSTQPSASKKGKSTYVQRQPPTTRWTEGKRRSKQYYWDEPGIPYFSFKKNNEDHKPLFPPEGMDLSSA